MTYKVTCKAYAYPKNAKGIVKAADCQVLHTRTYNVEADSERQAESIAYDWYADHLSGMRLNYGGITTRASK